jgi:uncharacterized protein YoxC
MGKVSTILEDNKKLKRKLDELESTLETIKKTADGAKRVADQAMSKAGGNATKKKKKSESPGDQTPGDN